MHTSVGGGTRDFQQSLWSQDDTFHLASLLLTLGRSRNCSCSWRKPRRRRTSFKNKYVLTAAMLWGRTMKTVIHSLSCSLNFSHMANELRTTPAETHTHTPLPMLVHTHTQTHTPLPMLFTSIDTHTHHCPCLFTPIHRHTHRHTHYCPCLFTPTDTHTHTHHCPCLFTPIDAHTVSPIRRSEQDFSP